MFYVSKNVVKVNMVMKVRDKLFNNNVTKACQFMFQDQHCHHGVMVRGGGPVNEKNAVNSWRAKMKRMFLVIIMNLLM